MVIGTLTAAGPNLRAAHTEPYVGVILRLAYLAPDVMEAILNGRQPIELTLARIHKIDMPLDWPGQRSALGFETRA